MSYLVLARKYRPQTFEEVVHQDHVTRTLANAVQAGRVAHAVLLSGPRGTGKTTVARILAKAMNCQKGPTPVPCNACRSCTEITRGHAADVYEIDGASNNSVDQVRELRENARYMPAYSPYKIYIIDEVHMLSPAAFNALLKTLEEPPPHVLFIFATTEPNKIPATVLSRCQRHDFRRIDTRSIVTHMETIISKENVEMDPECLWVIAREATGGMRDALSLLDQVMTCAEDKITLEQVLNLLGVMDRKVIFDLSRAVLEKDAPGILERVHEAYSRGYDMKRLFFDLLEHFRNLMVAKTSKNPRTLVDLPAGEVEQIVETAGEISPAYLNQIIDILLKEESAVRFSSLPRIALEMALVKTLEVIPALPIEALIEKLEALRGEITAGAPKNAPAQAPLPPSRAELEPEMPPGPGRNGTLPPADAASIADAQASYPEPETRPAPSPGDPWDRVVQILSEKTPSLAASLSKCKRIRETEAEIEVEVHGNGYDFQALNRKKNKTALAKACQTVYGRTMTVYFVRPEKDNPHHDQKPETQNDIKNKAIQHPLVAEAIRIFGGTVVDVKLL
ncbi:MAG: DNA polymerase III subunit gamma/tau [Deltaproteobacteria bacterium]|nr:DNA polymerase III subunit gamma/tau [Deltaproteobacteria bacterium]